MNLNQIQDALNNTKTKCLELLDCGSPKRGNCITREYIYTLSAEQNFTKTNKICNCTANYRGANCKWDYQLFKNVSNRVEEAIIYMKDRNMSISKTEGLNLLYLISRIKDIAILNIDDIIKLMEIFADPQSNMGSRSLLVVYSKLVTNLIDSI
jgi:hypothetical protein